MQQQPEHILMYPIRQRFPGTQLDDLVGAVEAAVATALVGSALKPGATVALTAGSRGISHLPLLLRTAIQALQARGYCPVLVSAMGSHGGGSGEGQRDVLHSLGVTEESVGAPVLCSAETVELGVTDTRPYPDEGGPAASVSGLPVYMAKEAFDADGILVLNRIKPHTAFQGSYESGLLKMIAVGLGRASGASAVHRLGASGMARAIPSIARAAIERAPIIGGIAVVENAREQPAWIEGFPAGELFAGERRLLAQAKQLMPALPISRIDLCLVGEMGKNYSGTGMDSNIIGRMRIHGVPEPMTPDITYIGVLGLSEASHGNAAGIGLADFTTEAVARAIDREATYLNCLTSGFVVRAALPMTFRDDRELVVRALGALKLEDVRRASIVFIHNTLHLEELWVSEAVWKQLRDKPGIDLGHDPRPLAFDSGGRLTLEASAGDEEVEKKSN